MQVGRVKIGDFRQITGYISKTVKDGPCRFVCVILRFAVLVERRLVTDRHRRTQAHGYSTARMHSIARYR